MEEREGFRERFGRDPEVGARAPGRVNWIGEHTDYNRGLVLPCAIDRETRVWAARGGEGVRVHSRETGELRVLPPPDAPLAGDWTDYVRGVLWALAERGAAPEGLDLAVASEVPLGSGLSSSAALCVGLATALGALLDLDLGPEERARVAWRAETGFVGVACGIMDQYASALGRRGCVLRLDCRSEEVRPVAIETEVALLVAHSGVHRRLAAGGYGDRRAECEAALAAAREAGVAPPDADSLRALDPGDLPALEAALPDPLFRRARHVLTENARVDAVCEALGRGDGAAVGACLRAGQASLRDDFEVSVPELDALCELGDAAPGVWGSRLTGAGFGGCTLHLVEPGAAASAAEAIAEGFAARFGRRPPVLEARASDGASLLQASDWASLL